MSQPKLELVSFKLCPFVQRALIVLREKGLDADITYIDISNPPDWFKAISPFGKVPLLKVDGEVLFESAVIMEYLDEAVAPRLHPDNLVSKARHRGWMEFSSDLLGNLFQLVTSKDDATFDAQRQAMRGKLERLEGVLARGQAPWFDGEQFRLVDAAFAPFFMRLDFVAHCQPLSDLFASLPRTQAWRDALLSRSSVQQSVVSDLGQLYTGFVRRHEGHICQYL